MARRTLLRLPASHSTQGPRDRLRCTGSGGGGGGGDGAGQDGTTRLPKREKSVDTTALLRELPALAEFLEAKAHMAHAASLHNSASAHP
jgi:hypothetical protein